MDHQIPKSKWKVFWSKPPFVIFLFCLALFAITTFSLSVYIAQADKIQNPNVLDWNRLLKKLTKLEYCLPKNPQNLQEFYSKDWISSTLKVDLSPDFIEAFGDLNEKVVKARGQVLTRYLGHLPPQFFNQSLVLNFELPRKQSESSSACLEVQGPAKLLEYLQFNQTTCHSESQGVLSTAILFRPLSSLYSISLLRSL